MSFLAPAFFLGLAALAVPILIHLIQRERKDVVHFPSLMFIRRIPYQSVQRRRIHNWLLLLLRAAAMLLLVAAFSRPFFKQDPTKVSAAASGARDVVMLLDDSASMGYADRWDQARAAARKVLAGLGRGDQATLVLFGSGAEVRVKATPDLAQVDAAIQAAAVTSDATRYGPALRLAQTILGQSVLPRKEAVLISDFQKTGWERREEIHLPEGATLTPISGRGSGRVERVDLQGRLRPPAILRRGACHRDRSRHQPRRGRRHEPAGEAGARRPRHRHAARHHRARTPRGRSRSRPSRSPRRTCTASYAPEPIG